MDEVYAAEMIKRKVSFTVAEGRETVVDEREQLSTAFLPSGQPEQEPAPVLPGCCDQNTATWAMPVTSL